ncbi:unnamed protein product [Effrenium voratum]|nr:unnamed protein product [Effrenium voratum]
MAEYVRAIIPPGATLICLRCQAGVLAFSDTPDTSHHTGEKVRMEDADPPLLFSADYDVSWLALDETFVALRKPDLPAQSYTQCLLGMCPSGKNASQCHTSTRGPLASPEDLSSMLFAQTRSATLRARGKAGVFSILGPRFSDSNGDLRAIHILDI